MSNAYVSMTMNAPADEVWKIARDFGGVAKWVPGIARLNVEGSGVGAVRRATLTDGGLVVERLESLNDEARTMSYATLQTPLPLEGYIGSLEVRDLGGRQSEVVWSSTFGAKGVPEAEIKKLLERSYRKNLANLQKLLAG